MNIIERFAAWLARMLGLHQRREAFARLSGAMDSINGALHDAHDEP